MADLWLLALGFGLLPLTALLLAAMPSVVRTRETATWGLLAGVVAFLGFAHAGATILEGNAYLRFEAGPAVSAATAAAGLVLGIGLGWVVLGRRAGTETTLAAVAGAAAVYVALHSVADGFVLGEAYAGPVAPGFPVTAAVVGGTLLHRFAEGALIVVPAILAAWRPPRWIGLLLVGLITLPAAFVPVAIFAPSSVSTGRVALDQAVSVFAAGVEAGFAALFLFLALLPRIQAAKDRRWAVWAGLAFTGMLLLHFLVE